MEKMYFIDFDSYCYEDGKIHGDLGWESDIEFTQCGSIGEAITSIRMGFEMERDYCLKDSISIYSIFEGIYFDGHWDVPRACDREYVYRIACCSEDEGKRLGIDANEYIG